MLNNVIKEKRLEKGLSQEELAKKVGVSRQTIIAIEKEDYVPSLVLAINIANVFQTNIESLFTIS